MSKYVEGSGGESPEDIISEQIRRATQDDLDRVWTVIKKCSDWLLENGLDHWDAYYSKELIEEKLNKSTVFVVEVKGNVVGTVTISTDEVEYYTESDVAQFSNKDSRAVYVTALAVLPSMQGLGIGSALMKMVEDKAFEMGISTVRFDCRARYKELVEFYLKNGYSVVGLLWDEEDNNEPYCLMEKLMEI